MSVFWAYTESPLTTGPCDLSADEARHLGARRLRPGGALVVFDGEGGVGEARLVEASKRSARVEVVSVDHAPRPAAGPVLASAIPKGDRLSTMLQMLSQLGARVWQPLVLEHSVVRSVDPTSARLQRILVESAKVARRPWLLEVRPAIGLDRLLADARSAPAFYGDRQGAAGPLPAAAGLVVIGPEAGFSEGEHEDLSRAAVLPAAFSAHNLRIETAAIAAAVSTFAGRATPGGQA
ncbi:MAG: RsmE family RNA methyltransferase [Myxococcota bacterium]